MKFLQVLNKWADKLEQSNKGPFGMPVSKQTKIINDLSQPCDEIERSFFQYKCQMRCGSQAVKIALNVLFFPLFILFYLKKNGKPEYEKIKDAVFFADGKPFNIVPVELKEKYKNVEVITEKGKYISVDGKKFIKKIWKRYPFSFYYLFKILLKISFYDYEITRHNPVAFIVCNEYSFTSSALTKYCRDNNILHINVMHGEKLFYMRDSFFEFDEFYVWDKEYIDLFVSLRAKDDQFIVSVPDSIVFEEKNYPKKYDYVYYLGAEEGIVLKKIMDICEQLSLNDKKVAVRPHPRYTKMDQLKTYKNVEIENVGEITIEESVLRTKNAIALFSTVLNQAYHNGINVVIDDVTRYEYYLKLNELKYVMLSKEHKLLSEIIKES